MSKLLEFYNVYVYHLSSLHSSPSNPVVSSITVILLNSSNATPWQPVVKFNGYYSEYLQTRMVKLRIAYRNLGSGESIIGKVVDRRGMRLLHFCIVTCLIISQYAMKSYLLPFTSSTFTSSTFTSSTAQIATANNNLY
ncbi:hypothetical protein E3Q18_02089 [Wallemia mellicola]|uniref:Uncharacterized protein n=1 Tax=Wallemia mellicola TaxID=1708541 RepID=A0A4T0PT12_9BASI|nr:hypothetical protein E3Q23_01897 [Wallemia mellicola]TIB98371.1 hypothetical protein E3Q18_02089 [Wallemia mellicola]TIC05261.1 hypothetical protein E3Q16_02318 [Wallemia mellicola]TIC13814.1 hypothetical protein E3Q15_01920 [Wallemia mellicola]TIC57540.1 hypothetical protein E3Q05_01224 [Wallemia mellicola]